MSENIDVPIPTETEIQTPPTVKELIDHLVEGKDPPINIKALAMFLKKNPENVQQELDEAGVRSLTREEYKQELTNHRIAVLKKRGIYSDELEDRAETIVVEKNGVKVTDGTLVKRQSHEMTISNVMGISGPRSDPRFDDPLAKLLEEEFTNRILRERFGAEKYPPIDETKPTNYYGAVQSPDVILEGPPSDNPQYNRISEFLKKRKSEIRAAMRSGSTSQSGGSK